MIITNGQASIYTNTAGTDPTYGTRTSTRRAEFYFGPCQWRYLNQDLQAPAQASQREVATIEVLVPYIAELSNRHVQEIEIKTEEKETITADIFRVEQLRLVRVTRLTATLRHTQNIPF